MKQLLTISALVIMLLLQYSRQAAYLQCKLANIAATQHCDCEKIMTDATDDHPDDNLPPLKIQAPDELFVSAEIVENSFNIKTVLIKPTAFLPPFHAQLYRQELIMPPRV